MRILLVNKFYYRRGGDCVVVQRTENMLREHGHDVAIFAMSYPLNDDSQNMFDKAAFEKMKRSALFVNTARGGVMVEQDLYCALKDGKIGGACIDTLAVEPMVEDCILMDAPNCIITPHIAWAPVETRQRLIDIVVENIKSFYRGERLNRVI